MNEFRLPDLGSGHQEAEIVTWHVAVGDAVTTGEPLCDVETAKSVVELPVPFDGVVLRIAGEPGTVVAVGDVLVVIGEDGEFAPDPVARDSSAGPAPADDASLVAGAVHADERAGARTAARPLATPLARRIARAHSLDLAQVKGSGRNGRISRKDVEAAIAGPIAAPSGARAERVRLGSVRRAIGEHMSARWREVPHITAHLDADATALMRAHGGLSEELGTKVPLEALLIMAAGYAITRFPEMNAEVDGDHLVLKQRQDIGFAVASPDGLLVPVVRDAGTRSLRELAHEVSELSTRALERTLSPSEQGGQTFTISNLGPVGGGHVTQILPAGTSAIASFGMARETPASRAGVLSTTRVMAVSGSFDHRAIDGAPALRFLNALVDAIEDPGRLLLQVP